MGSLPPQPKATVSRKRPTCAATNDRKGRNLSVHHDLSEGRLSTQLSRSRRVTRAANMGHFDRLAPTSPSVGCRLGQGTFAEAIRQLPRRAENGTCGRSRPPRRLKLRSGKPTILCSDCSSRSSSRRVICDRVAAKVMCRCSGCCFRTGRRWSVSDARPHIVKERERGSGR